MVGGVAFVMWALPAPVDAVLAAIMASTFSSWLGRVGA
jgi:hypothetical protein